MIYYYNVVVTRVLNIYRGIMVRDISSLSKLGLRMKLEKTEFFVVSCSAHISVARWVERGVL